MKPPRAGKKITLTKGVLQVHDAPVIPFIKGDGTGRDMWPAAVRVLDAAVAIKGPLTRDAMAGTIRQKRLIDAFARLVEGAPEATCCAFATALIENI